MHTTQDKSFNDLVEQFLGIRLAEHMSGAISLTELASDTQDFIRRALVLMKRSGYSATGFNPYLIRWLSTTIPRMLPSAWGGRIPPITLPGRHKKLDAYVAIQNRSGGKDTRIFLDAGCGFPPLTTAETALKLPEWKIIGVDHSFADYVLYDMDGHYACFGKKGEFLYFQALMNPSGRTLYANPDAAKNRFNKLFMDLFPLLRNPNLKTSETVEKDGNKLIHNHILDFEADNLTFLKADIKGIKLPPVHVIRCMNTLIYYEVGMRKKMLLQAGEILGDAGILIAGTNGLGIQSRYAVYKNSADGLSLDEFAFGLDNLGHIVLMPFFTIHENDPEAELLADLAAAIRADRSFWLDFSRRADELLQHQGICQRKADGFLYFQENEMLPHDYLKKNALLWQQMKNEDYVRGAVTALKKAGYEAWENPVGDVAIRPPEDFFL